MTKYAIFICTRIIVRIMPTGTSLYGLDYNSMQQYIRDIVHRAFYLLRFLILQLVVIVVAVFTLTHRYNAVHGRRSGAKNSILPPLFNMHGML